MSTTQAGINARERYLAALRRHESELTRRPGDYELRGLCLRIRQAIEQEAYESERQRAEEYAS